MQPRGLTLLELVIALAMLAVVTSLAVPSFGSAAARARLKNSAETLAADLAEARYASAQRGRPLFVEVQGGADWCWSVATVPGCPCGAPAACQMKNTTAHDHPGITLLEPLPTNFTPDGAVAVAGGALLQSARGDRLRVRVTPLGRASICTAAGNVPGYPAC